MTDEQFDKIMKKLEEIRRAASPPDGVVDTPGLQPGYYPRPQPWQPSFDPFPPHWPTTGGVRD